MKKIISCLSAFAFLFIQLSFGQEIKNSYHNEPPGTLLLVENLYIDKSPVTNLMYIEYLNFKNALQNRGKSDYEKFLSKYDSKKLPREFTSFLIPSPLLIEKYATIDYLDKKGYAKKRKYDHHPVLEVSQKEATDFCSWRTAMVNFHFRNINDLRIVNYRLASKEELENAKSKFMNYSMVQHSGKITQIKKQKIAENFTIFPINELTASEQLFNDDKEYKWDGFRCMCEVQTID